MTAKFDALCTAIREYAEEQDEGAYVDAWVLVSHKRTAEMEQNGQSVVSVLSSPEISWVVRRGLLDVALNDDRFDTSTED